MTDRELMQMALDALFTCQVDWIFDGEDERPTKTYDEKLVSAAFKALRARLAQPEQAPTNNGRYLTGYKAQPEPEPVAWRFYDGNIWCYVDHLTYLPQDKFEPLYTAPPQRGWQGLTDEEIFEALADIDCTSELAISRTIEAKLKEKNT